MKFIEKQTVKVENFKQLYYEMSKKLQILKHKFVIKVDIFCQLLM